jgi:streptomycin 6-kinase
VQAARDCIEEWHLTPEAELAQGDSSVVLAVRTEDGLPAVLKVGASATSEHEHLALRRWNGDGAVRLLRADPRRRALLLERLSGDDLTRLDDVAACEIVANLYRRIHVPALPQLSTLSSCVDRWTADLGTLPRNAPIPRRLVEQAISIGRDVAADPATTGSLVHGDLHYAKVLAADREPWLVIGPEPLNGDPHYELAPMLWSRWDELAGDIREGVRRRFYALVDSADFDEHRARSWLIVRTVHRAMSALTEGQADPTWLTTCVALAKAVQD